MGGAGWGGGGREGGGAGAGGGGGDSGGEWGRGRGRGGIAGGKVGVGGQVGGVCSASAAAEEGARITAVSADTVVPRVVATEVKRLAKLVASGNSTQFERDVYLFLGGEVKA